MGTYTPYQARYFAEQILLKRPQSSKDLSEGLAEKISNQISVKAEQPSEQRDVYEDDTRTIYGVTYPRESLTGTAKLGDTNTHCITPEWMFRFKTAYAHAPKDIADVRALAEKYGYEIPETHRDERKLSCKQMRLNA
jgi:hypothetical protein